MSNVDCKNSCFIVNSFYHKVYKINKFRQQVLNCDIIQIKRWYSYRNKKLKTIKTNLEVKSENLLQNTVPLLPKAPATNNIFNPQNNSFRNNLGIMFSNHYANNLINYNYQNLQIWNPFNLAYYNHFFN